MYTLIQALFGRQGAKYLILARVSCYFFALKQCVVSQPPATAHF